MASKFGDADVAQIFRGGHDDQQQLIKEMDKFVKENGVQPLEKWEAPSKEKNLFLHELADLECYHALKYAVEKYKMDPTLCRKSDGKNLVKLLKKKNAPRDLIEYFEKIIADKKSDSNDENDDDDKDDEQDDDEDNSLQKKMNIVWMDLEMTSIEDPIIMECAVIITDRNLNELDRAEWVVHHEQDAMEKLGEWHQNQFKAKSEGGNNLFVDCLKSKLTERDVEQEVLKILKKYCPKGECPLAGSSIHIDRDVLRQRMPEVFKYLHYRIIDVSSFRAMLKRWKPSKDAELMDKLSHGGQQNVNHRAMDDIEWSIALMKLFRPMLVGRPQYREKKSEGRHERSSFVANHVAEGGKGARAEPYSDEKALLKRMELEREFRAKPPKMNPKDQNIYEFNPHLREVFLNQRKLETFKGEFKAEHRLLSLNAKSTVPSSPSGSGGASAIPYCTTEHWEMRKICLSDLEFLTNNAGDKKGTVLYIGAAPGFHLEWLSQMFPELKFIVLDSKRIEAKLSPKIRINSLKYTNTAIDDLKNSKDPVFLIANVHTFTSPENIEIDIRQDMDDQLDWHRKLKPDASMLTFRINRKGGKTRFYDGDFFIEPWNSRRPNDCRIVVTQGASQMDHDNQQLMQAMNYFQNVTRTMYYDHKIDEKNSKGLDHCYDCRAEIRIIGTYLKKIRKETDSTKIYSEIPRWSLGISQVIYDPTQPTFIKGKRTLDIIK